MTLLTAGTGAVVVTGAAVTAGLAMDEVTTVADSYVHGEFRPSGHLAAVHRAIETGDPVAYADVVFGVVYETGMVYTAATCAEEFIQKRNSTPLIRVMESSEVAEAVATQKLTKGFGAGVAPLGETWVTESVEHTKTYLPKQQAKVAGIGVTLDTVELEVKNNYYRNMKINKCIDQRGSNVINQTNLNEGRPLMNVTNQEHLVGHPQGKVNVGIKNANLNEFNENVSGVKKVDPFS